MKHRWGYTVFAVLLSVVVTVAQVGQCDDVIATAISIAQEACEDTGRNQACFGHIALEASAQPDATNFKFSDIGDIVSIAEIGTLTLAGFDSETGAWGLVLMQVQANLPATLPGQNVTLILFGDTTLRNAAASVAQQIPPEQIQTVSAAGSVNVRRLPTTTSSVLGSVNSGTAITATGRTADNQWIRINYDGQVGWIASFLLSSEDGFEDLVIVEPDAQQFGPMQAFYLSTGIGRPSCNEVPDDGLLVQTPQGAGTINLFVNEVEVELGSTVYFNISDERRLQVQPIEGAARVRSGGQQQTAVAGTQVEIQLDENFSAIGEPFEPESYLGDENVEFLPIDPLERDIDVEFGLDDEEFELFLEYGAIFDSINVEDIDDVFTYIDDFDFESGDLDLLNYLIDELDYIEFDDELESYFEEAGYDLSEYDSYIGDDDDYYYDFSDDNYGSDDGYNDYDDSGYNDYDSGGYDDYDSGGYDGYDDSGGYDGYDY